MALLGLPDLSQILLMLNKKKSTSSCMKSIQNHNTQLFYVTSSKLQTKKKKKKEEEGGSKFFVNIKERVKTIVLRGDPQKPGSSETSPLDIICLIDRAHTCTRVKR